jgi:hypothetical protein
MFGGTTKKNKSMIRAKVSSNQPALVSHRILEVTTRPKSTHCFAWRSVISILATLGCLSVFCDSRPHGTDPQGVDKQNIAAPSAQTLQTPSPSITGPPNGYVVEIVRTPSPPNTSPQAASISKDKAVIDVLNWQIVSTILTIFATFLGFLGSQKLENRRKRLAEDQRYKILLTSAKDELEFYKPKLTVLSEQLNAISKSIEASGTTIILPSFNLYPAFLETLKSQILSFMRDGELSKEIGHCHFELCHIRERLLELIKNTPPGITPDQAFSVNIAGFKTLVDNTISSFTTTADDLEEKIKAVGKN